MGYRFNQLIELPNTLTYLSMGSGFKQPITLPKKLKYLKLNHNYNHIIEVDTLSKDIELYIDDVKINI